jgi:K+ transporter
MSDSVSNRAETLSPEVQRLVPHDRPHAGFWGLTLGAIGVVYGDIGTSPLYALRESVLAAVGPGAPASETVVLGILSLIIWALVLVVTVKYVVRRQQRGRRHTCVDGTCQSRRRRQLDSGFARHH